MRCDKTYRNNLQFVSSLLLGFIHDQHLSSLTHTHTHGLFFILFFIIIVIFFLHLNFSTNIKFPNEHGNQSPRIYT